MKVGHIIVMLNETPALKGAVAWVFICCCFVGFLLGVFGMVFKKKIFFFFIIYLFIFVCLLLFIFLFFF